MPRKYFLYLNSCKLSAKKTLSHTMKQTLDAQVARSLTLRSSCVMFCALAPPHPLHPYILYKYCSENLKKSQPFSALPLKTVSLWRSCETSLHYTEYNRTLSQNGSDTNCTVPSDKRRRSIFHIEVSSLSHDAFNRGFRL